MVKNKILKRIVAGLSCIALSTTMLTSLPAFADDYVDEYQYYSTLDPNGEEYQEWKSNLASSAVSVPQNRMLKSILKNNTLIANDYIEFNTASNGHYTIGTIGGNPNSSTDDNKKMLFGHPGGGTSKTTIVVGESINEFTSSNVTYDADGSKSVSKASYDGVDVTQELSIIENSATGRDDVVKIKYIVKNDTEYAKQVGIRIMMDTMLGGNDAAPFRVNGSDVTTETVYSGSNIPQIWQAFDSATNPGVVAQGTFYKSGDRKPDKVQFTNWGNVTSTLWDYVTQPGRSNGDSAVSITWNKDTFTSGETREFVTYYGLSELEQNLIPPLALSVYADNKVSISNFNYDDINANVYLDNIGDGDATDVSIKITADNLEPKYGTSLTHNYSVIKPSKSYSIPLKFIVPTDSKHNSDINAKLDFELSYKVAKTGDTEVKRITKNITIPKLKRAVVVVPGIMGIDLAKTSNDESVWGSWIEQPSNFDDVKKIHNAFQSLKCDYYGNSNSNTINPNIVITNNSDKPLKMSDITINYVFNADNKENLEYHCDWLAVDNQYLGNTSVCEFVNDDYGNTYAKIKFNTDVELQPNKQFVIHFRLNAADWSNWDTSNDYSMGTEQLLPNDKIIVFYNEQLISGVQP